MVGDPQPAPCIGPPIQLLQLFLLVGPGAALSGAEPCAWWKGWHLYNHPTHDTTRHGKLALEDGTVFTGRAFGHAGTTEGEVVFNTSMTSWRRSGRTRRTRGRSSRRRTLIGNYGINRQDAGSRQPHVAGFVVKELAAGVFELPGGHEPGRVPATEPDRWDRGDRHAGTDPQAADGPDDARRSLDRAAGRRQLVERGRKSEMARADWVQAVKRTAAATGTRTMGLCLGKVERGDGLHVVLDRPPSQHPPPPHRARREGDGAAAGRDGRGDHEAPARRAVRPQRPGDPAVLDYAVRPIQQVLDKLPIFGICLGHQLGRAIADTCTSCSAPRRQPAGAESRHRAGGDHQPEPRVAVDRASLAEGAW